MLDCPCEQAKPAKIEWLDEAEHFGPLIQEWSASGHEDESPFSATIGPVHWLGDVVPSLYVSDFKGDFSDSPGVGGCHEFIDLGFVARASELEQQGHLRESLRLIYRNVEDLMREGSVDIINSELASVDPHKLGTDVLLGLLTATLPVKSRLPDRRRIFKATRAILVARGHYEAGILKGLE
jgi:hypothetical protein